MDLHWTLAQCRMLAGSGAESLTTLDRALASPGLSAKHRARLLVLAARTYLYLGELEAADREADGALASAQEAGDAWATGWALHVLAIGATIRGDLTDALPLYDRGLAVTETDPALTDLGLLLQINKAVTLVQPQPVRRGAGHGRAGPAARGPGGHRRSGWPRRTASSASCSSRPGAGTTRWRRSRPCRRT